MLLDDNAIQDWLSEHPGWSRSGEMIQKTYSFDSFRDAIVFVNRVASLADEADHHPDMDIRYDKVRIGLSTHSEGGVTKKDAEMAGNIDRATSNR